MPPADSQIPLEHVVAEGDPAEQIEEFAAANKIDLIVMGTHGRTGLARFLTGSIAEQTLRRTPCPMLVVRLSKASIVMVRLGNLSASRQETRYERRASNAVRRSAALGTGFASFRRQESDPNRVP